ncbi:alanine/glycine:cation symporter family protein [Buchananella hordeovulneris]|uniref:Sodium:alanine symporter family protein n=1 Tax=Buchananella hordeovulneris TaxID=52770 RepID=A0A1Q5PVX8_9ACTO|nr:alanine/glycine:cation symporter family protein [Buchananella hordeovulneris]OKL51599.1 sodium:alanine symporter family protein [Buchananella hordeovulneris]
MDALAALLERLGDSVTLWFTIPALIGTGLFLTSVTRVVQVRHFGRMLHAIRHSRRGAEGGISSFQAFTISLAARVGIGNIFGVAAALALGGPGAIFWMWIVALVGTATAFSEATLAQIFKVRHTDGSFRGGPATYMARGLGARWLGMIFAVLTVITCAFSITMVQANAIAGVMSHGTGLDAWATAVILAVLTAPVVLGGVRAVARVTEWLAPVMAVVYLALVAVIVALHLPAVPGILWQFVSQAFAPSPAVGGIAGGLFAAIINGTRRGLFSNEAGQGTAPNAAATATVAHPVQQGHVQALGVLVDTLVVCTATAVVIMLAGPEIYTFGVTSPDSAGILTQTAVTSLLGAWAGIPIAIVIFVLAYSSIIAAATYSEINVAFLTAAPRARWVPRLISSISVVLGALTSLRLVWNTVDLTMAVMTGTNLLALVLLYRWTTGALRHYEAAARQATTPRFTVGDNPYLPQTLPAGAWPDK